MGESRIENILEATINGEEYTEPSGSRIETLLIELNELIIEGGGGGSSTAYATALSLSIDSSTYVMTAQLLNKDGDPLGTAQTVDLPLESVVVGATYDNTTKSIILTLQSGSTTSVPVGDLVAGLVSTTDLQTALLPIQGIDSTANNYIELKSGQREYLDTMVPTGNIPTGSIGMGFDEGVYTYESATKVSEGEPNLTYGKQFSFYGNGQPLADYTIYGATGGVGEKTANLFDGNFPDLSGTIQYMPVYVGDISVTLETTASASSSYDAQLFLLEGNVASGASSSINGAWAGNSRRVTAVDGYVTIAYRNLSTLAVPLSNAETWLFERFQLPIICGNTTTNIYIDRPLGATDSIDYTTSQVAIPTIDGLNMIYCDTTVQPSKISLTYAGWHSDQDGLQTEITSTNKLSADLVDDTNANNKFYKGNGVLFVQDTEPTGTIPDGAIWIDTSIM